MRTGIIFDMDGTLWDSAKEVAAAWNTVTKPRLGIELKAEDVYSVMGMPMDKLALTLFPGHDLEELMIMMDECGKVENDYLREHGAVLYPKLEETLNELAAEYPLYIVSNCQDGYIEAFLEYYHFEAYFQDHLCFGINRIQKDENIALIIKKNGLERGIYVGDIQADYDAAKAAGAEFIHAAYGFGTVDAPVPRIESFSQLPEVLRQLIH